MTMENKGSVTRVLDEFRVGAHFDSAAQQLWEHAFSKLIRIARGMLRNVPRGAADEEDIALSAFQSLCDGAARGRFPNLDCRDSLWRVLYTITLRKVMAQKARETAGKRNARRIVSADIEAVVDHEPNPEFAVLFVDELRFLFSILRDDGLRQVARLVLDGLNSQEIAEQLNCHVRTIERKRALIRRAWEREQTS
jgi:DNA-directed RNA polymerase specialized sigma24 family protein